MWARQQLEQRVRDAPGEPPEVMWAEVIIVDRAGMVARCYSSAWTMTGFASAASGFARRAHHPCRSLPPKSFQCAR